MKRDFVWWSCFVVCIIFIVFLLFIGKQFLSERKQVSEIKIELIAPPDSIESSQYIEMHASHIAQLDSAIVNQEIQLNRQYELFMKARNEEADLVKILSCVGAFVLAMFSLLGIKKFSELHEQCCADAKNDARIQAENIAKTSIKSEIASKFREELGSGTMIQSLKDDVSKMVITGNITPLEERIIKLEMKSDGNDESNKIYEEIHNTEHNLEENEDSDPEIEVPMPNDQIETN